MLWIQGGIIDDAMTDTTVFLHINGTYESGPILPTVLEEHCSVTLHDGRVMLIGKTCINLHRV